MKLLDTILISILISIFVVYFSKTNVIEHLDDSIVDTKSVQNLGAIASKILNKNRLEIGSNVNITGNLNVGGNLNIVPPGTIVAFHKDKPPPGWALCDGKTIKSFKTPDLRFRFILGNCDSSDECKKYKETINAYNKNGNPKLKYEFGDSGGEFAHKLTVDELASHTHNVQSRYGAGSTNEYDSGDDYGWTDNMKTAPEGKDMPHNNMPPYYILTYIIKLPGKSSRTTSNSSNNDDYDGLDLDFDDDGLDSGSGSGSGSNSNSNSNSNSSSGNNDNDELDLDDLL